jgi:hypothetical protein
LRSGLDRRGTRRMTEQRWERRRNLRDLPVIRDLFGVQLVWPPLSFLVTKEQQARIAEARARLDSGDVEGAVRLVLDALERP